MALDSSPEATPGNPTSQLDCKSPAALLPYPPTLSIPWSFISPPKHLSSTLTTYTVVFPASPHGGLLMASLTFIQSHGPVTSSDSPHHHSLSSPATAFTLSVANHWLVPAELSSRGQRWRYMSRKAFCTSHEKPCAAT